MADKQNKQTILLKLSSNNDYKAHADTPEHHLKRVMYSLVSAKDDEDYKSAWRFGSSLGANNEMDVKTLLVKYKDVIETLIPLFQYKQFLHYGFSPKELVECKRVIWGVCDHCSALITISSDWSLKMLQPFISGGSAQLSWLASDMTIPEQEEEEDDESVLFSKLNWQIFQEIEKGHHSTSTLVGDRIVKHAESCFKSHLMQFMDYFGQDSSKWEEAWHRYTAEMKERVKADTTDQELFDECTDWDRKVLKVLPSKLAAVLDKGLTGDCPFRPFLDGMVPILCPTFLTSLIHHMMQVEKPVEMASLLPFFL